MSFKILCDQDLLTATKQLVAEERQILTRILQHLRETDRRRLYSDLGCASLFEYGVKQLQYSESQASRRIQAMRLIKEIPEIEAKINSGSLSLSNISQAQSFFRDVAAHPVPGQPRLVTRQQKLDVLQLLEGQSTRDGQKKLIELGNDIRLPKERERVLPGDKCEVRFVMEPGLRHKLDEVRSLLGSDGTALGFAALIEKTADVSTEALREKKFGKKRVAITTPEQKPPSTNPRYITREVKHHVWQRDKGCCTSCGTRRGLNYDHVIPVARGGLPTIDNLRLLCFNCNQRAGLRMGLVPMRD